MIYLASCYIQVGYREGITEGKEAKLQQGFDEGFAASVPTSRRIGRLRGQAHSFLAYLKALQTSTSSTSTSSSSQNTALVRSLFQETSHLLSSLSNIKRQDLFPPDLEAKAHAKTHAGEEQEDDLSSDRKDVEDLELAFESMAGRRTSLSQDEIREEALLSMMEARLDALKRKAGLQ